MSASTSTCSGRAKRSPARRAIARSASSSSRAGRAIAVGGTDFGEIGERLSPFAGQPWSVYVPVGTSWRAAAVTDLELAVCSAPGGGTFEPRLIGPDQVGCETRGKGANTRHVANILPETEPAHSLLVVEVVTPAGNWSSYPPHKHDRDALPDESLLEETYYHRLDPPQGYALQRVYTDDRSLDEALVVEDRSVVAGAARLPSRRRAARLRSLLPQRDGRPEARLALPGRSRPRLDLAARGRAGRRRRAVTGHGILLNLLGGVALLLWATRMVKTGRAARLRRAVSTRRRARDRRPAPGLPHRHRASRPPSKARRPRRSSWSRSWSAGFSRSAPRSP